MDERASTEFQYNIVIEILSEMVSSYISKYSNLQKVELKNEFTNNN